MSLENFSWEKFMSREFLVSMLLTIIATFAMFTDTADVSFVSWAAAVGGFTAIWTTGLTTQKVKGVSSTPKV